jgi:hypothetical protein
MGQITGLGYLRLGGTHQLSGCHHAPACCRTLVRTCCRRHDTQMSEHHLETGCSNRTMHACSLRCSAAHLPPAGSQDMHTQHGSCDQCEHLQKWAVLAGSCGSVASCMVRAVTGSSDRLNWSYHRNSKRARDSSSSHACAAGCCCMRTKQRSGHWTHPEKQEPLSY